MRRFIIKWTKHQEYVQRVDHVACPPKYWELEYWTSSRAMAYVFTQDTYRLACKSWNWLGSGSLERIYLDEETDLIRLLGVEPKRSAR